MPTDKNEPWQTPSRLAAASSSEKISNGGIRVRQTETGEHHYEPEAHHQWFPSEGFFFRWLIVGICGFLSLCVALTAHHVLNPGYHVGDIAEHEIRASHATVVVDLAATRDAQDRARAEAVPVFKPNAGTPVPSLRLKTKLAEIGQLQTVGVVGLPELKSLLQLALLNATDKDFQQWKRGSFSAQTLSAIRKQRSALSEFSTHCSDLTDSEKSVAINLNPSDFAKYSNDILGAGDRLYRVFSKLPIDEGGVLYQTAIEFMPDSWPDSLRSASASLVAASMRGCVSIDKPATDVKADKAAAQVKPIMRQIEVDELIVEKGTALTQDKIKSLQAMGITGASSMPLIGGLLVSLTAAVALVALFLYTFEAKLLFSTRSVSLMYMVAVVTVALAAVLGKTYPQTVPIPAAALLLAIFFGQRAALAIVLPLTIFIAADRLIDFNNMISLITASGAAIATYSKRRHALMSTGLLIGVAQAFGFLASLAITQVPLTATELGSQTGTEFLGGLASSIVAIGMLPFLENIFGLITPFRLAELTDADQPLLRRLEENAPGTYQHSLGVANLAEAGARSIGADVNLVRAGAFYHDVGKMVRPKYFIENQLGSTNPHDAMSPEDSRERVLAHVCDGIELAKRYSLPKAVQDFIPMHQGTSLMAYFYHKACMRDGVDNVDPEFYRYPGPKPQSKETSIVMLADVSEAVTHSMKDPTEEEVEAAITKVLQNRWDDGQFCESGLTSVELQRVKKAFVRVWRTLHHDRLKYPSTTTGRMPMPPSNLPTAAILATGVTGNEFVTNLPMVDESCTQPSANGDSGNGADAGAQGIASGDVSNGMGSDAKGTASGDAPSGPGSDAKRAARADKRKEVPVLDEHSEHSIRDEGCC
jgi:putative nucleotidyltransferase with HDIG domain